MQLCYKDFGCKIKELLSDFSEVFQGLFCGGLSPGMLFFHSFTHIFKFVGVFAQLAASKRIP